MKTRIIQCKSCSNYVPQYKTFLFWRNFYDIHEIYAFPTYKGAQDFLDGRLRFANKEDYNSGFDWAAGTLLRKEISVSSFDQKMKDNRQILGNSFITGAIDACNKLIQLNAISDDTQVNQNEQKTQEA